MYDIATSKLLKTLSIYKDKSVTLCVSGGVHSAALILGLKAAGVRNLNLVHFIIGKYDNDNYQQDLIAVRNLCESLNQKFTSVTLNLQEGSNWIQNGRVFKHHLIAQQVVTVMDNDTDYCIMGMGSESKTSLLTVRKFFNTAKSKNREVKRSATMMLPITDLSTRKIVTIMADLSDILQYETVPRLTNCCTVGTVDILMNGISTKCGKCRNCKSLGDAFDYIGYTDELLFKKSLAELNYLYHGKQKLLNMICGERVVTYAMTENNEPAHSICSTELIDSYYTNNQPSEMTAGEWNYSLLQLPEEYEQCVMSFEDAKAQALEMATKLKLSCFGILESIRNRNVSVEI